MPSYIEVYILTENRDRETINRFLKNFTNREEIEGRADEELMILDSTEPSLPEKYFWIQAETLTKSINLGLNKPGICFTMFLRSNRQHVEWLTITFTIDNKLVLGLSLFENPEYSTPDNYQLAEVLKGELMLHYNGKFETIGIETNSPRSETEFLELLKSGTQ